MIIEWRLRRSRMASASRGIFFWSRVTVGTAGAGVITAGIAKFEGFRKNIGRMMR